MSAPIDNENEPPGSGAAHGSETGPTVAMLRLPLSLRCLNKMNDALKAAYGEGLTMREAPKGWLDIRDPKTKSPND